MSKRLLIYCEGQTEEMFVERLLRNHLELYGVKVERPELCATSMDPAGQRGGFVNWDAIDFDLRKIFAGDSDPNLRFTTFLDVYRMPPRVLELAGFKGSEVTTTADVEKVEDTITGVFEEPRFKAYLQRHEFEALLLADIDALQRVFPRNKPGLENLRTEVQIYEC